MYRHGKRWYSSRKIGLSKIRATHAALSWRLALYAVAAFSVSVFLRRDATGTTTRENFDVPASVDNLRVAARIFATLPPNLLVVEPFHGLGNRLRAYASAAALAKKSGRKLVVVWIPDVHVNARLSQLFDTSSILVLEFPVLAALRHVRPDFLYYDYNAQGGKDKVILDKSRKPVYVRSAYILQAETKVSEADMNNALRELKPVSQIMARVSEEQNRLQHRGVFVGVHIRMLSDLDIDVPGISKLPAAHAAGAHSMGPVKLNRDRCHYKEFIPHLEQAVHNNRNVSFLVASDMPEAINALRKIFGEKVVSFEHENCSGSSRRDSLCLQSTLAEFFLLSRVSSALILSDWSSASELILRLSYPRPPHKHGCSPKAKNYGFLNIF